MLDMPQGTPPGVTVEGDGGGFYCPRCDEVDCDWLGSCPHTPKLWFYLNPQTEDPYG